MKERRFPLGRKAEMDTRNKGHSVVWGFGFV